MKNNIDLTESRDFSKKKFSLININLLFKEYVFPWSTMGKRVSSFENKELVFTGDREDLRHKKQQQNWHHHCERCGYDGSRIPWNIDFGLCLDCLHTIDKDIKYEHDLVLRNMIHKIK